MSENAVVRREFGEAASTSAGSPIHQPAHDCGPERLNPIRRKIPSLTQQVRGQLVPSELSRGVGQVQPVAGLPEGGHRAMWFGDAVREPECGLRVTEPDRVVNSLEGGHPWAEDSRLGRVVTPSP
jgi:hypothetical protein